jgi:hypothetical protein
MIERALFIGTQFSLVHSGTVHIGVTIKLIIHNIAITSCTFQSHSHSKASPTP